MDRGTGRTREKVMDLKNTFVISWRFTARPVGSASRDEQTHTKISSEELSIPGGLLGKEVSGAHILYLLY